jgi:hypothetical protein
LRHGGVIVSRRAGKNNFYSLTDQGAALAALVKGLMKPVAKKLARGADSGRARLRPSPEHGSDGASPLLPEKKETSR